MGETKHASETVPLSAFFDRDEADMRLRRNDEHLRTARQAVVVSAVGCALFGVALGAFGMNPLQVVASAVKVPILLLGTTVLCFPTFYTLHAMRSEQPLTLGHAAAVQAVALAATGVVWAGFSLPVLFLVSSTANYKLAQVLALAVGTVGGGVGFGRFLRGYRSLTADEAPGWNRTMLAVYLSLFAAVGGQLAWVLRPFIGDPGQPFALFREAGGSMLGHIIDLLLG